MKYTALLKQPHLFKSSNLKTACFLAATIRIADLVPIPGTLKERHREHDLPPPEIPQISQRPVTLGIQKHIKIRLIL